MKKFSLFTPLALAIALSPLNAQKTDKKVFQSPNEIVDAANVRDWRAITPLNLLVMDLSADSNGDARQIIIQLMPRQLSTGHIDNIRILAMSHWWDGTSINRVQDNYVVQWGNVSEEESLPEELTTIPQSDYQIHEEELNNNREALEKIRPLAKLLRNDPYAAYVDFEDGWPLASDLKGNLWPIHCYGAVGVGRSYSPDTGSGAELYTVIGHAPRHLDRNIAVVGRIIEGIEHLSSLPRGTGPLGFYEKEEQRVAIKSIRLASELPEAEQPRFHYLSTTSKAFAQYVEARANRRDPFFIKPAGGADICNIPVPVRRVTGQ